MLRAGQQILCTGARRWSENAAAESVELFEVALAETCQLVGSGSGDGEANHSMVGGVTRAAEVAGLHGAIDEAGRAVVAEQQSLGNVADRRGLRSGVSPDREEELVLRGCESFAFGFFLAPVQEPPQLGAELEQSSVVRIRELSAGHRNRS